jgi:hypothetical protein
MTLCLHSRFAISIFLEQNQGTATFHHTYLHNIQIIKHLPSLCHNYEQYKDSFLAWLLGLFYSPLIVWSCASLRMLGSTIGLALRRRALGGPVALFAAGVAHASATLLGGGCAAGW